MKLLFDENLPPQLAETLASEFPGSRHVFECGLAQATDAHVWQFATAHGFAIVTKDSDFQARSVQFATPPKVIWIRIGNCSVREIEDLLINAATRIQDFDGSPGSVLILERSLIPERPG